MADPLYLPLYGEDFEGFKRSRGQEFKCLKSKKYVLDYYCD